METTAEAFLAAEVAVEALFILRRAETATAAEALASEKRFEKFLAYCVGIWYDLSCENKCISWKEYKGRGLP